MPPLHTLIFDLGNVFIPWDPRRLYNKVFPSPEKADWFVRHVVHLDWNEEQDKGRPVAEATEQLVAEYPEWEREIRMYYDRFPEHFDVANAGTVRLFRDLQAVNAAAEKRGKIAPYRLLALTNWSAEMFPWARENYPFLADFEDICVSGEIKMKKPEPRIYEHIRKRWDLGDFSGCVFIDDSPRNVEAARKLGLDSIRFREAEQVRASLVARGVMM